MNRACAPGLEGFDPLSLTHYDVRLTEDLGVEMYLQRDDLMPVPFGGNKWIKLSGIVGSGAASTTYISNGGIDSNHCRAMAAWAALNDRQCHFVLHGDAEDVSHPALQMLDRLGSTYEIVPPDQIARSIQAKRNSVENNGESAVVVPGGGHSREGVLAFSSHAAKVLNSLTPDYVVFASGTGGTQAGIIHAINTLKLPRTQVFGVSVAREAARGRAVIEESLSELGVGHLEVNFLDEYRGGGYGKPAAGVHEAMTFASRRGLILDPTYTGKAFSGMLDLVSSGRIAKGKRVLFWHTGGGFLATQPLPRASAVKDSLRRPGYVSGMGRDS